MSIWGKPNIERLIQNRDAKGLNKALETKDYPTIRDAIVGLISLNEIIFDLDKILYLINDPDPEIRKVSYSYTPIGTLGLFTNVTAAHDPGSRLRIQGLQVLYKYHLPGALEVLRRSAIFDPDENVRSTARNYYEDFVFNNPMVVEKNMSVIGPDGYGWFSYITLFEEFVDLIERKHNKYLDNNLEPSFSIYDSPVMNTLRGNFRDALSTFPHNEDLALRILLSSYNTATKFSNWEAAHEPASKLIKTGLPFNDFQICSIIIFAKTNRLY